MLTKIARDTEHLTYRERAREALLSGKLEWRHHGIGVLQAYLGVEGDVVEHRLHIWSRILLKPGIDASGDAHDHRFDMVSHVLFGTMAQEEWKLTPSREGQWTTMTVVHARAAGAEAKFHAPMQATGERYTRERERIFIATGSLYSFPARQFHRSPVEDFTITWVEKHHQTSEPARIAHPIDIPAVPAFGHEMDVEKMKYLLQLAVEVLR